MKKTIALLLACVLCLSLFAACGKTETPAQSQQAPAASQATPADSQETPSASQEDTAEPQRTLKDFAGSYTADRCTITVEATSDTEGTISVHWAGSVSEAYEWTMSGSFDCDTMRLSYSNGVKKCVVFNEDGTISEETVEYENGFGRLQFFGDGTLRWEDELEADNLVGMTFAK